MSCSNLGIEVKLCTLDAVECSVSCCIHLVAKLLWMWWRRDESLSDSQELKSGHPVHRQIFC